MVRVEEEEDSDANRFSSTKSGLVYSFFLLFYFDSTTFESCNFGLYYFVMIIELFLQQTLLLFISLHMRLNMV